MTVNEMIKELQAIVEKGHGDAKVISRVISDYGDEEIACVEYVKKSNEVNLWDM